MSMKKPKFRKRTALCLSLALSLLLLIAAVGITIHVLHKQALTQATLKGKTT